MSVTPNEPLYAVINLGTAYISGMLARKHPNGRIYPLAQHRMPSSGCIRQGCVHNIDNAACIIDSIIEVLSSSLPEQGRINSVYVGLDCRSMASQPYTTQIDFGAQEQIITQEHLDELRRQAFAVQFPSLEVLHLSAPSYILDGKREANPRGVRCRRLEATYQLITVRKSIVSNVRQVFDESLSLGISGIVPTPLTEAMLTLTNEEAILGSAFVNIGAGTTSLAIFHNRLLSALYVLPMGGGNVTRDLMSLKLIESDAERLKLSRGSMRLEGVDKEERVVGTSSTGERILKQIDINRLVAARMNEILGNVFHVIEISGNEDRVASGLVLSGGGSRIDHLTEALASMEVPMRFGHIRADFVDESVNPSLLREYSAELSLVHFATEDSLIYEPLSLEYLFESVQPEPKPAPAPTIVVENDEDEGYNFDEGNEKEIEEGTKPQPRRPKRPAWVRKASIFFQKFNANDED